LLLIKLRGQRGKKSNWGCSLPEGGGKEKKKHLSILVDADKFGRIPKITSRGGANFHLFWAGGE